MKTPGCGSRLMSDHRCWHRKVPLKRHWLELIMWPSLNLPDSKRCKRWLHLIVVFYKNKKPFCCFFCCFFFEGLQLNVYPWLLSVGSESPPNEWRVTSGCDSRLPPVNCTLWNESNTPVADLSVHKEQLQHENWGTHCCVIMKCFQSKNGQKLPFWICCH